MIHEFGSEISFVTIYIMEAHAGDTWPMGFEVCYNQTNTTEERCAVARDFVSQNNYEFPVRIDPPPKDAFNSLFAAWPLRFYVIDNDNENNTVMKYIAEPLGDLMPVKQLHDFLRNYLQK